MTRRVKAMGPCKAKQRVLQSALILVASVAVTCATWERSCGLGHPSRSPSNITVACVAVWLAIEGLFWVMQTFRYHKLNEMAQHPPNDDVQVRIEQFMSLAGLLDMREFISGWFKNAPFETLNRAQVLDFVAYGFWYQDRSEMPPHRQEDVEETLQRLESTYGFHVPEAAARQASKEQHFMCHLWEPLRVIHKPLIFAIMMEASSAASGVILCILGFSKYSTPTMSYWARNVKSPIKGAVPAGPVLVDSTLHDHDLPVSKDIRWNSFLGRAVHRTARASDHWRQHQAPLSAASRSERDSTDVCISGDMIGDSGERKQELGMHAAGRGGVACGAVRGQCAEPRAALMSGKPTISFPSVHEVNLRLGVKASERMSEGKQKAAPLPKGPAHCNRLDEDLRRQDKGPQEAPIVFLHGVGLGALPYLGFIRKVLFVFPTDTPVIVPEIRHVSQRLVPKAQPLDQIVGDMVHVLKRHQLHTAGAHFIAHSFGTFVLSHTLHLYPSLVKSALLCDPVCMLTCCPQLLRQFVYQDVDAGLLAQLRPSVLVKRILGRDLIIAESFCRNFWWHKLMLWPSELPPVTVVCLSNDDDLVPCELVQKQLQDARQPQPEGSAKWPHVKSNHILDVILSKGPHGAFLASGEIQGRMLSSFRDGIHQAYG